MESDNDTIIIFTPDPPQQIKPIKRSKPRKPRKPKVKTGLIKNVRMDIEELNELKELNLRKDTRSDIFMGNDIDKFQKSNIHRSGKVYVRGHTKKINNKIVVIKPHIRNK